MLGIFIFLELVSTENHTVHLIKPDEADYVTSPHAVLDFANYLYETEDYQSAAIEYERVLFLGTPDTERIILQLGRTYFQLSQYVTANKYLARISSDSSLTLRGFSYLYKNNLDSAKYAFSNIKDKDLQTHLNTGYSELLKLNYKSPLLAGVLSSVLPGSGRLYAGRGKDAIFSFIFTVGSFALSCYYYNTVGARLSGEPVPWPLQSVIFGSAGILFYFGDIYGSVESARIYNRKAFEDRLTKFKNDFNPFF